MRLSIDRVQRASVSEAASAAGEVVDATGRLVVATGDGNLEILQVQPAGKRAMSAAEFLRGNRIAAGDRLGPA